MLTILLTACKQKPEGIITNEIVIETQSVTNETAEPITETEEKISTNNEMVQIEEVEPTEAVESQTEIQLNETDEPVIENIYTEEPEVENIVKETPAPQPEPETYVDPAPNGYENTVPLNPQTGEVLQPGQSFDDGWGGEGAVYLGDTAGLF